VNDFRILFKFWIRSYFLNCVTIFFLIAQLTSRNSCLVKLKAMCSNCCAKHYEGTVILLSIYTHVPSVISRATPSTRTSTSNKFTSNCHLKSNCHLQSYYETATVGFVLFPGPFPKQWVCFQRWCSTSWWMTDLTLTHRKDQSLIHLCELWIVSSRDFIGFALLILYTVPSNCENKHLFIQ